MSLAKTRDNQKTYMTHLLGRPQNEPHTTAKDEDHRANGCVPLSWQLVCEGHGASCQRRSRPDIPQPPRHCDMHWQVAVHSSIPTNPLCPFSYTLIQFPFHHVFLTLLVFLRTRLQASEDRQGLVLFCRTHTSWPKLALLWGTGIPNLLLPADWRAFCGCQDSTHT